MADSFKEEQARKARAQAEKCFLAGNVPGARRWVQSALRLAPDLPGSAQASTAYDVHAAAARQPVNWYAVLCLVRPRSSGAGAGGLAHGDIKRQHRRLCLLVHPDKNPSAAADGAFKLIQAAWEALSARHPPVGDATIDAAPARRRPDPPPQPQPRRRRPPTKPQGPHQEPGASHANATRAPQAARRPASRPPTVPAGCCPSCGALTPYGKRNLRCMVCHWSPMDRRHFDDDDDDYFE